ncbi:MAG: drug/metabolite transporter (DMT)-like permease [Saprospiraceae bacterium]|jgi:drug/metabolite transporter (DMT)-like permease
MNLKSQNFKSLLELNLGIICISTSGVLGKYITMSSTLVIFYRSFIGMMAMGLFCMVLKKSIKIDWQRDGRLLIGSAILMGAHWITYFYALDFTTIAIAMLCIYVHPAITVLLEPLILKVSWKGIDLVLAGFVLVGVIIMVPPFGEITNDSALGIILGLSSALCYSLRNIVVRGLTNSVDSSALMFYQTGIIALILSPFLFTISSDVSNEEWLAIISLGILTSAIGHTLYVQGLKAFRASTVGILSSILPVYGILWGYIFLHASPNLRTIIGGIFILGVVLFKSLYQAVQKSSSNS